MTIITPGDRLMQWRAAVLSWVIVAVLSIIGG